MLETITGEITVREIIRKTETVFADPDYSPEFSGVIDMREASSGLTKVELYGFADLINHSDKFGRAPWAIIADDPLVVALSQVFQKRLRDVNTVAVVGSVEAAADFLDKQILFDLIKES